MSTHEKQKLEIAKIMGKIQKLQFQLKQLQQNPGLIELNQRLQGCFNNVFTIAKNVYSEYKAQPKTNPDVIRILSILSSIHTNDIYNDVVYRMIAVDYKRKNPRKTQTYSQKEIVKVMSKKSLLDSISTFISLINTYKGGYPGLGQLTSALDQLKSCVSKIPDQSAW